MSGDLGCTVLLLYTLCTRNFLKDKKKRNKTVLLLSQEQEGLMRIQEYQQIWDDKVYYLKIALQIYSLTVQYIKRLKKC